jgi:hypothetical protein
VRAIVISTENTDTIADGALLYTCTARVAADAANSAYEVAVGNVVLSTPEGAQVPGTRGYSGYVLVGLDDHGPPVNIPGPVATATATAQALAPTRARVSTATATATDAPPVDAGSAGPTAMGDDGGCQASRPAAGQSPLFLLAAVGLILLCRKMHHA